MIAAVVPAYQAAPSVGDVVRATREQLDRVLVVDDGSTDDTSRAASAAGADVIRVAHNRGKGHALRSAFAYWFERGFDGVVTLDADGQHLPGQIPILLEAARAGADLVIGDRRHLFGGMSTLRRCSNTVSSALISAVAGAPLGDVQCGFRLYTRRLIDVTGFPEDRFEAESAVVVRAVRAGFEVVTVPVELGFADGRLTSHYRPLVDSVRIFNAVAKARLETVSWSDERSS